MSSVGAPVVVGMGACTSIGIDCSANDAAIRATLNVFTDSSTLRSKERGDPLKIARLAYLPPNLTAGERMREMALAAANDALQAITNFPSPAIPVLLSSPPVRPGLTPEASRELTQAILDGLPVTVDSKLSATTDIGNAGGLACLQHAVRLICMGEAPICLIGGVESYLHIDTLQWLEAQARLCSDEQAHGMVPGEGAGFVLLCSPEWARHSRLTPVAEIAGTARSIEQRAWYRGDALLGEGLSRSFEEVFQSMDLARGDRVRSIFCDMNGESWRSDEWGYAYTRAGQFFRSPMDLRHPASSWGDVGAASGTLLLAMACLASNRGFAPRESVLVWTASDLMPYRSACLLRGIREVSA